MTARCAGATPHPPARAATAARPGRDAHRRVWKSGSQRGADSYLQLFPDDGIVVAVLSNRRGASDGDPDGHDTSDVGRDIGTLILGSLP